MGNTRKNRQARAYSWVLFVATVLFLLLLEGTLGLIAAYDNTTAVTTAVVGQRAREVRMVKDVLVLASRPLSEHAQSFSELQDILPLWESTQKGLQVGDASLGLPRYPPTDVVLLLSAAQSDYTPLDVAFQHIVSQHGSIDPLQLQIVQEHDHGYAVTMSQVTTLWRTHMSESAIQAFWFESGVVVATLLLAMLSFWLITRPALHYDEEEGNVSLIGDIEALQVAFETGRSEVAQDFVSREQLEARLGELEARLQGTPGSEEAPHEPAG